MQNHTYRGHLKLRRKNLRQPLAQRCAFGNPLFFKAKTWIEKPGRQADRFEIGTGEDVKWAFGHRKGSGHPGEVWRSLTSARTQTEDLTQVAIFHREFPITFVIFCVSVHSDQHHSSWLEAHGSHQGEGRPSDLLRNELWSLESLDSWFIHVHMVSCSSAFVPFGKKSTCEAATRKRF